MGLSVLDPVACMVCSCLQLASLAATTMLHWRDTTPSSSGKGEAGSTPRHTRSSNHFSGVPLEPGCASELQSDNRSAFQSSNGDGEHELKLRVSSIQDCVMLNPTGPGRRLGLAAHGTPPPCPSSLQGVPVAYDNIKVVGELGDIYDDQGFIHLDVEADFVIFSPKKGKKLVGVINKVAPSHIGCLIHGCFNASIPKPEQMSPVQWQELGFKIGDELKFQVLHLDSDTAGVFFIRGGLTKSSMRPKKSDAVPESTNGDEVQKLDHQENGLNNSGKDNVTEEPLNEMGNLGRENEEEPGIDAVNGLCDDKKKKKKKKEDKDKDKQGEQELVLPTSDSSGYQSDHKKSKKKKRKHCDEVEESELSQLSEKPKAKKKRTEV
ncbi:DNA-directed RNA polymerase I subunit RPA43 [Geospiza fortis]|uniref:DNA-directed RNA polymerase subunit n=1 Tax=Geospiza fortis TaxID=48883 RepID=A0A8N5EPG7_GEOFO|nr:DNA-directed RNA polymerase I subunit RPA43 [Geospiza fortis]